MNLIFHEIRDKVKSDIDKANEIFNQERKKCPFYIKPENGPEVRNGYFSANGFPIGEQFNPNADIPYKVNFALEDNKINITTMLNKKTFCITKKWDVFQEECLLYINIDEEENSRGCTIEQISQLALEPLFFKN